MPRLAMNADGRIAVGLFFAAWLTFAWFFGGTGWNQDAHFDLTRAVVERRTLFIDGYDANTGDVSRGVHGHTFINKPPGVSLLAAIPYAAVFAMECAAHLPVDRMTRLNLWIVTALTCGITGAMIGPVLYLYGRSRKRIAAVVCVAVALAISFGTITFAYSTMLFAHVPAALFLLLAVTMLEEHPLAAGMAAGMATGTFYVCGAAAAILLFFAALISIRVAVRFAAGAAPFLFLLGLYQWSCFGSPWLTAVEASTSFTEKGRLFGVLARPTLGALYGLTFSPFRGLFFASPVLLFVFVGTWKMITSRDSRREIVMIAAISLVFLIVIAGFNGWDGGWSFGPRYLLPIVPIVGVPILYGLRSASRWTKLIWAILAVLSIGINFIATATDAMPPPKLRDPIRRYQMPAFFTGRISEKTRDAFPWNGSTHVDKVGVQRDAGNAGELLLGKGQRSSVAPIVLWMLAASVALLRTASSLDRRFSDTS